LQYATVLSQKTAVLATRVALPYKVQTWTKG